jgi:ribosome-associated translation inhibitor RaiA
MRLRDIMTMDIVTTSPPETAPLRRPRRRTEGASLPTHVRVLGGAVGDRDRDDIARKLGTKLGKFGSSIERITVRLSDVNGPKGGRDQHCQVKVVLNGLPTVVVNETHSMLAHAVDRAIDAAVRAVRRSVQRRRLKALHHRASQASA